MVWLGLLLLMLLVAAVPGISMYVEHLRRVATIDAEQIGDGQRSV